MFLTRDEARELDRRSVEEAGVPSLVLMENAGRGCAELLRALGVQGPVVVCCGRGSNGGDGFVIARHLDNAGVKVRVLLFARPKDVAGDAAVNYRIVAGSGIPLEVFGGTTLDEEALQRELAAADWVVDALFGTGLKGAVRPPFDRIIAAINASGARVLAIDIPSGLDCDTGEPQGTTIRAHHTATMVGPKKGFGQSAAQPWVGRVHAIDIGLPRGLLTVGGTCV
jgi:NAD(P)H-hydrate epimerase